jgi:hypothetical protein
MLHTHLNIKFKERACACTVLLSLEVVDCKLNLVLHVSVLHDVGKITLYVHFLANKFSVPR